MTTMQHRAGITAQRMSDADAGVAFKQAVKRSGFSLEELRDQARRGEFETLSARLAWIAIQALGRA